MGPRLVGRGKLDQVQGPFGGKPWLQWGRVLWDAESVNTFLNIHEKTMASMGPRLVGRGKENRSQAEREVWSGFNGAASCGTRKGAAISLIVHRCGSFNGAASCGTRKDGATVALQVFVVGFNGAASCGTRKDGVHIEAQKISGGFNGAASCGTRKEYGKYILQYTT